jgi:hypothetical protein
MNMKRGVLKLAGGSLSLACAVVLLFHAVPRTRAAHGFNNGSITGAYAYAAEGFLESNPNPNPDFGPVASDYAPVALAGLITFDGKGQFHIMDTGNLQGGTFHRDFMGTYSVNPDGSGSMTFFSFGGTNKTRTFYIAASGEEIKYVETDDPDEGAVTSGTLVRQGLPGRD